MLTYRRQQEKVDEYLAMKSVHSGLRRQLQYGLGLVQVGQEIGPLAGIVAHSFGSGAAAIALHRGSQAERAVLISELSRPRYP